MRKLLLLILAIAPVALHGISIKDTDASGETKFYCANADKKSLCWRSTAVGAKCKCDSDCVSGFDRGSVVRCNKVSGRCFKQPFEPMTKRSFDGFTPITF